MDNVRRLWRIVYNPHKRPGITPKVLLLSDGGGNPWSPMQCHLEETSIRRMYAVTTQDSEYLLRVCHPQNPFAPEPEEDIQYSKETGQLTTNLIETPRTIFHYVKRSNRTAMNRRDADHMEEEQSNAEALRIINSADLTTLLRTQTSKTKASTHVISMLNRLKETVELTDNESRLFRKAIKRLHGEIDSDEEPEWNSDNE